MPGYVTNVCDARYLLATVLQTEPKTRPPVTIERQATSIFQQNTRKSLRSDCRLDLLKNSKIGISDDSP
jgi:hypothetical protein